MQDVYGGAYAAGCIYVPVDFAKKYPNTAQAIVNAMVRALRFIQTSTPDQIVAAVPPEYYSDKALYKAALEKNLETFKHDGIIGMDAAQNVYRDLKTFDPACRTPPSTSRRRSTCRSRRRRRRSTSDGRSTRPPRRRARGRGAWRSDAGASDAAVRPHHLRVRGARRGRRAAGRYTAVENATLAVAPGEFVSVVGPDRLRQVDAAQRRRRAARALVGRAARLRRAARGHQPRRRATCSRPTR